MPLFSRKDFATYCKIEQNYLRSAISKGKVIETHEGYIDSTHQTNLSFYESKKAKWKEGHLPATENSGRKSSTLLPKTGKSKEIISPIPDDNESEIPGLTTSTKKLKHLDTIKRQKEIELLKKKVEKINGTVVPSEMIKPVILQHNQSITNEFKNATTEMIRLISKKYDLTEEDTAEINGKMIGVINDAIRKATEQSVQAVKHIVADYTESRGVGERL